MTGLRIVVLGTMAADPYAGMAWMHMQITAGLLQLGHDVYYLEATSAWPYDPDAGMRQADASYATGYLRRITEAFGLAQRWAYRRSWGDGEWMGPLASRAESLLLEADLVLNISGSTSLKQESLSAGRLVYFGTDPVRTELLYAQHDPRIVDLVNQHHDIVSYGENIGTDRCHLPPLPRLRTVTRQPVLMAAWKTDVAPGGAFTTVGNWRQDGQDLTWQRQALRWSKHHEFLKFIDVPGRSGQTVELATNLDEDQSPIPEGDPDCSGIRRALSLDQQHRRLLLEGGWHIVDGPAISHDPWRYRDYIHRSRAEFTVAREVNVKTRSGWFSERSACYLAAGRPVVTQETGFSDVIPTGEGLFAFETVEQAVEAIHAINADYARHASAARAIAQEFFSAEVVLPRLLCDLGF